MHTYERNDVYEYLVIKVPERKIPVYLNYYECFGWEFENTFRHSKDTLTLRRDRNIANKAELAWIQRSLEICLEEVNELETSKKDKYSKLTLIFVTLVAMLMVNLHRHQSYENQS